MRDASQLAKYLSKAELIDTLDLVEKADKAGTEDQFRQLVAIASRLIPLERMHVCFASLDEQSQISGFSRHILIDYPSQFVQEYLEGNYAAVDPAWDELMRTGRAVIWHDLRQRHRSPEQMRIYAAANAYGLRDGFTFGARFSHFPGYSVFAAICDPHELPRHQRHLAVIDYLTPHLHAALGRIQLGLLKQMPVLTEREREVMHWAKFGKTDWEISLQIGCSARTVKFHIENVMHKLQASNRVQAIAIALSQGLVDWG